MAAKASELIVVGQVCHLVPSTIVHDGWEVIQKFVPLAKNSTGSSKTQFLLQVPGRFVHPLSPNLVVNGEEEKSKRLRWLLQKDHLEEKKNILWDLMNLDDLEYAHRFHSLHLMSSSEAFPYRDTNGESRFIFTSMPKHLNTLPKLNMNMKLPCFMCNKTIKLKDMRNHVGKHILFTFRDQEDASILPGHQVGLEPCGFCGLDGCSLHLSGNQVKTMTVHSSCLYQYDNWSYKNAVTATTNLPCTNVPIHCELCPIGENGESKAIWRYNVIVHMILHHEKPHPELYNTYILPKIPSSMLLGAYISKKEEHAIGILSQATIDYREDFGMMKSDDPILEEYKNTITILKPKRKGTVSIVEPHTKRLKES